MQNTALRAVSVHDNECLLLISLSLYCYPSKPPEVSISLTNTPLQPTRQEAKNSHIYIQTLSIRPVLKEILFYWGTKGSIFSCNRDVTRVLSQLPILFLLCCLALCIPWRHLTAICWIHPGRYCISSCSAVLATNMFTKRALAGAKWASLFICFMSTERLEQADI